MLVYLSAVAVVLCIVHLVFNYNARARGLRRIPGPIDRFIVGNAIEVLVPPVELFKLGRKYARHFKGIYRIWSFPVGAVNIYNPEDIEKIISSMKHHEKSVLYSFLKPWLQDGLLLSKGSKWQQRRKILTSAFHFNILQQFCVTLEENSRRLVDSLRNTEGESIDIVPILSEYTLNSICETAMGSRLHDEAGAGKSYKEAIYEIGKLFVERFVKFHLYSDFIFKFSSLARKQNKYLKSLHEFTARVIEERIRYVERNGVDVDAGLKENEDDIFMTGKRKKTAMLDLLISARRDGLIDRTGIQEEVDTFMFEGHDTTASGLTCCLMVLANNKIIQDKIVTELEGIFGESTRAATITELSMMRYLECCIKESLRLYPPVPFISRNIHEAVELSNYTVPAGTICHIHIYDLHRRQDLFKDPHDFNPERFLPENCANLHPYAYIPFSAGPRNCIGQKFAIMEMKSCISEILRNFELRPVTQEADLQFMSDLVLRNSAPVYVKFVARKLK